MVRMNRRGFLAASAACALTSRFSGAADSVVASGPGGTAAPREEAVDPQDGVGFSSHVLQAPGFGANGVGGLMYVPTGLDRTLPPPVLVLLHGYSQHHVGKRAMASWARDYGVLTAHQQLRRASLAARRGRIAAQQHFHGAGTTTKPATTSSGFHGMVLVCPATPVPYLDPKWSRTMDRYVEWLADELLPAVQRPFPELANTAFGLAGVSMGGHVGLEVLTRRPDLFSSFTGLQAAIKPSQALSFARRLRAAFNKAFGGQNALAMKVVTSSFDTYRSANEQLVSALDLLGVNAALEVKPGLHTRDWMQRVGSVETLVWQDRVLREALDAKPTTLLSAVGERCPCASSG